MGKVFFSNDVYKRLKVGFLKYSAETRLQNGAKTGDITAQENPHTGPIHLISEVASVVLRKQPRNKCFYIYAFLDSFQSLTFYNVCDT